MARTSLGVRNRTESPAPPQKRTKLETSSTSTSFGAQFATGLLDETSASRLHEEYIASEPYKHVVIEKLFKDDLLRSVKEEILRNIHFTEKETDIYKVNQTGDLASLSYLSAEQLALFPSLKMLRDALYGDEFRTFLRSVTGCGHLSGSKQDMSINSYKKGCHLLNHDDVIGTREVFRMHSMDDTLNSWRVSYILYLPLPVDELWNPHFGGALELYPTIPNPETGILEPLPTPSKVIPPSWNQFVFFEVQPGKSFHSVEEVVVESGTGENWQQRQRLSISGWFHKPQEGEEGYEPEDPGREKSSLEQLSVSTTPLVPYTEEQKASSDTARGLTDDEVAYLTRFLNPAYLSLSNLKALANRFIDDSSLELHMFLREDLANKLDAGLRAQDAEDGYFGDERAGRVPTHASGLGLIWRLKGPPHKLRHCILSSNATTATGILLAQLQDELFPSPAFRSWLHLLTTTLTSGYRAEARRFRPGLDYTLARSEQNSQRLDVVLGLTPATDGWQNGCWGGWECYMAPHDGEEDPAVYRSGQTGRGDGEDEDGTLLVSQPGFNRLLVVLRDAGVLSFVKYVSAEARGSRWDVCGEWEVRDAEGDSVSESEGVGNET